MLETEDRSSAQLGPSVGRSVHAVTEGVSAWVTRHNLVLTVVAASVAPILYLAYINRFATNSFYLDDWRVVPIVHAALHGGLSFSRIWGQVTDSRLVVGSVILVIFGLADRLDLRSVIFLSAATFIASYAGLLALAHQYLGRRLTPIPALTIGMVWFSLADVENALWAFQVSWYLTVFFFVMMLLALLLPKNHHTLWFAIAILLAFASSLTTVQGFLCWPLGAMCILWSRSSRMRPELAIWLAAMIMTLVAYLPGYNFSSGNVCLPSAVCRASYLLHHPVMGLGFFITLIGNVIPASGPGQDVRTQAVGVALLAVAVFVLVQSWRHRASDEYAPLPFLLIAFALLFDLIISAGRGGMGPSGAVGNNRYVMANLILLSGIVVHTWAHFPSRRQPVVSGGWMTLTTRAAVAVLAIFLVLQLATATDFGLKNAHQSMTERNEFARVLVYAQTDHQFSQIRRCQLYVTHYVDQVRSTSLRLAAADRLGEFQPGQARYLRGLGLPPPPPQCLHRPS